MKYEMPVLEEFGSITMHTFTVCNPSGAHPITLPTGAKIGPPPKGPMSPTTHFDNFAECSETVTGLSL